jgi:hypothetical protein
MTEQEVCPICGVVRDGHDVFVMDASGDVVACLECYCTYPVLVAYRTGHYQQRTASWTYEDWLRAQVMKQQGA